MLKKSSNYINLLSILILIYLAFIPIKPHHVKVDSILSNGFSVANAYKHIKSISKLPHYSGSLNHNRVKKYIIKELQKMGLDVKIQKNRSTNESRSYITVENIIAKIKGSDISENAKSVVVMSHYDSALYSSHGASDAGAGVAVILEGIRTYLSKNLQPKNDIIILITDAEETGLFGAEAFVNKHIWAKNVGAVLNFEARGTAGTSYMFMETNQGNRGLLKAFNDSGMQIPQSHSLAYSIYKMLPNDTDLTVFRKNQNVGYNFAFIDNHFNYHTKLDNIDNLSLDSLAHHALYMMPMLTHLSQVNLESLHSKSDDVYFQIPFWKTVSYPFNSTFLISLINLIVLVIIVGYGLKRNKIRLKSVLTGGLPLLKSLVISGLISFSFLQFLYWLHPNYSEILQGFTYNGSIYIAFFSLLSACICYFFYRKSAETHSSAELMIIPILIWVFITIGFSIYLTGAHFFILISLLGTLALATIIATNKPQSSLTLVLFAPIVLIFAPIIALLPVALGLMILPFSGLLLILVLSVFISCMTISKEHKINKWVLIIPLIGIYIFAETKSSFNQHRPIPNSFYYLQDETKNSAYLFTNEKNTDEWSKNYLTENQLNNEELKDFKSKHWRRANIVINTEYRNIPVAEIEVLNDRVYTDKHIYKIKITPKRDINRMSLILNKEVNLLKLAINKEVLYSGEPKTLKENWRLATIYNNSELAFVLDVELEPNNFLDINLIEMSPDLINNHMFNIQPRPKEYIPKPFVYSDSIITKQKVSFQ